MLKAVSGEGMQSTRVYLVRHGQVEGHEQTRYNGQTNVALTALGKRQSAYLGRRLRAEPIRAVYSSDLDRTMYAAELIATQHGLDVQADAVLRELDAGLWEGKTWTELRTRYPEDWFARLRDLVHYSAPGGESFQDVADRVRPFVQTLIERHVGESIVLVAHGGVNRVILLDAIGAPLDRAFAIEQDYCCLNIIDYAVDGSRLVRLLNGSFADDASRPAPALTLVR
jgi:alpha-ribazole phosphatase/probable phosphoglycerate mutase